MREEEDQDQDLKIERRRKVIDIEARAASPDMKKKKVPNYKYLDKKKHKSHKKSKKSKKKHYSSDSDSSNWYHWWWKLKYIWIKLLSKRNKILRRKKFRFFEKRNILWIELKKGEKKAWEKENLNFSAKNFHVKSFPMLEYEFKIALEVQKRVKIEASAKLLTKMFLNQILI